MGAYGRRVVAAREAADEARRVESDGCNSAGVSSPSEPTGNGALNGHSVAPSGICALCGKHATGLATINDDRYCHGDDDIEPTCYQRAQWQQGGDATELLTDAEWDELIDKGNMKERR